MALWNVPPFVSRDKVRPITDPVTGTVQRTNSALEVSDGDAPAQKWLLDDRLPVQFTYGYAYGINELVMPKGVIVSVDPLRFQKDFETGKTHSVLTVANGGADVKLDADNKHWVALAGAEATAYTALTEDQKNADLSKRSANNPIGVNFSNVMKKVEDRFNGMAPTVMTEKYIKLPLFADKAHAYANPWGSCYGAVKPGDYVKSDENGRFVKWVEGTDKYSQLVGQVLAVQKDLVPEGAAIWATWALEDRLNSDYFNPSEAGQIASKGTYPGFPYEKSYGYNELTNANPRLNAEYQFDKGIPGLTDGAHVAATTKTDIVVDTVPKQAATVTTMANRYTHTLDVNVSNLQVALRATYGSTVKTSAYTDIGSLTAANALKIKNEAGDADINLGHVDFYDVATGLIAFAIDTPVTMSTANLDKVEMLVKYDVKGLAGVPTMLDWDGCLGEIRILVQK